MFTVRKQPFHRLRAVLGHRTFTWCRRLIAVITLFGASTAVVTSAPTGGVVSSGSANITLGTDTTIDQTSQRVDIDWTGFDTTAAESVTFSQPGSEALAVNRISGNRTQFDGTLTANGRIFLINQNGITFGAGARVNAGSLLATTSRLTGSASSPESHTFSGDGYGAIVNNGDITVSDGGFAVLAAPYVENNGFIKADLGQVELASTNDYTLNVDLRGDGLITFNTSGEWTEGGTTAPGVTSTGSLQARSGRVYLSANTASEIVAGVINLSGVVDADQFVSTSGGGLALAAVAAQPVYPGGSIKVESNGDINIGAGADIHAIGGETVAAGFYADGDINMGAAGDPARISLRAVGQADDAGPGGAGAQAQASLEMIAARQGGTGSLSIADGVIEVTADADGTGYGAAGAATTATASADLEGAGVDIHADVGVHARAEVSDTGYGVAVAGGDRTEALATLDVIANGEIELDTSGNVLRYGGRRDLGMTGRIDVDAVATTIDSATSKATANAVLVATGDTDVTGGIDVDADATSVPGSHPRGTGGMDSADANAALLMLGGTPAGLLDLLREVSLNRIGQLGTLSDMLTLTNLDDVLVVFAPLVDDPVAFIDRLGGIGDNRVGYTGDSNVNARADFGTTAAGQGGSSGLSEATAAGYFAAGGDVYINTDPVRVGSQARATDDDGAPVDTEARSFLVATAGLGEFLYGPYDGAPHSTLTVRGDLTTRAQAWTTRNGVPDDAANRLAAAVTALLATGDITVRGPDPLADADPAAVQGRSSRWQLCYHDHCTPLNAGDDGLIDLAAASAGDADYPDTANLAQLIIETLYGDIDIKPKHVTEIQPAGVFTDPIGPAWPGDLPLRFDASGRMLAATGADATRPPQIVALDSGIEAAILAGRDPGTLLPPTASGGCLAAGRDAFTVSAPDFFDRMISAACTGRE